MSKIKKYDPYMDYNRLPLENAYNVRDLGGYPARKGTITQYHRFLRSDDPGQLTKEEQDFLIEYGVAGVIDLRSGMEADIYPHPFKEHEEVRYINLPFITGDVLDMRKVRDLGFEPAKFYVSLVDYKELVAAICRFILEFDREECILFHCQAGKDRTGVLAMILLGICGVSKEDIVANYEVTNTYLKNNVVINYPEGMEELDDSKPEWIEAAYARVMERYGSFKLYLLACGLTKKEIRKLRRKLLAE